jgi:transcriptional regulator with XRE-family HTH domain
MNNAEKLKSFRLKHNLTQQQLADLLGVSQQIITYIETGAREPSDSFKLAFLRHYKVDFDELMARNRMYVDFERHAYEETCNLLNKEVK